MAGSDFRVYEEILEITETHLQNFNRDPQIELN